MAPKGLKYLQAGAVDCLWQAGDLAAEEGSPGGPEGLAQPGVPEGGQGGGRGGDVALPLPHNSATQGDARKLPTIN